MQRVRSCAFVLSALLAAGAAAAPERRLPTMAVSEVKPGMRGYGLSVFRGSTPERFDIEVIDVLENFRPDQDLVLIRTPHPLLDHAGSVAGMSGSPIYIDGRLVGAYAYGWSFGKDPIVGVTPIANMLHELDRPRRAQPVPIFQPLPTPVREPKIAAYDGPHHDAGFRLREYEKQRVAPPEGWLRAATPLLVGGMPSALSAALRAQFAPLGLEVLDVGGGAKKAVHDDAAHYVDGGAVAVTLLRGDVQATGVGTITYVDGKRAVAFGHPMLDAGEIGLPTATARVLHVLASERSSFKIAEAISPLGALVHDRQSGIVVDNDVRARTIPIRVRFAGVPDLARSEWNMEAASHRLLTPSLVMTGIASALTASVNDTSDMIYHAESVVTLRGHGEQRVIDDGYAPVGLAMSGSIGKLRLFELLDVAFENPFGPLDVERIDVQLELRFARDVLELVGAQLPRAELDPGEPARVVLRLRTRGGDTVSRVVEVPLSPSLAGEEVELDIMPGDRVRLEQPVPESAADLLRSVRAGLPSTSLVISVQRKTRGVSMASHVIRNLPGSALDILSTAHDTTRQPGFLSQERVSLPLGQIVLGHAKLAFEVRKEKR